MFKIKDMIGESGARVDVKRGLLFFAAVAALMLYGPVREYLLWTYKSAYYTHVVLIPLVSAYLVFTRRKEIFTDVGYAFAPGGAVAGLGLLLLVAAATMASGWGRNDQYALLACSTVLVVIGAFIALFGLRAFAAARFPLLFLAFMVPLPTVVEYWVIRVLQLGSAEFVAFLFPFTGMPVLRDACVFHLPGISIEVAPQCSGIRSSLALVITCVLAGHMFLGNLCHKRLQRQGRPFHRHHDKFSAFQRHVNLAFLLQANFRCKGFRDSNGKAVAPFLHLRLHASPRSIVSTL